MTYDINKLKDHAWIKGDNDINVKRHSVDGWVSFKLKNKFYPNLVVHAKTNLEMCANLQMEILSMECKLCKNLVNEKLACDCKESDNHEWITFIKSGKDIHDLVDCINKVNKVGDNNA